MESKGQIQYIIIVLAVIAAVFLFVFVPNLFQGGENGEEEADESAPAYQPSSANQGGGTSLPSPETPTTPQTTVDSSPPYRYNPWPSGGLPYYTKQVAISLETNEKANCRYAGTSGFFYESMPYKFTETDSTFHSTLIGGLDEGYGYVYYVRCIDDQGNENTYDFIINFFVNRPADFTPPERRNPYPSGDVFPAGSNITISVGTDEPADCRYSYTQGISYNSMKERFTSNDYKTYHTDQIRGLGIGNYDYFVRCRDLEGNVNTGDVLIHFTVQ